MTTGSPRACRRRRRRGRRRGRWEEGGLNDVKRDA
jgi:hypothetical protein